MILTHPGVAAPNRPRALLVLLVILLPFLAYFGTARSIVAIWDSSGTFAHGYVILPITLWLIWQRRDALARLPVKPWLPALLPLGACGFAWLLAELGEVQIVRQYAFAAMLPLTVLAVLGKDLARAMMFPLCFVLFGVPFGEVFIDPLIGVTANFTVDALRFTGIPVFREGNSFTIPTGSWSVVEACSGVRYLISSVTLGSLYAYLTFRSTKRRLIFVVLSMIVPIIANGLRAYMIVMMGHLSGMTMAVGFDHLIYGWVFFGLVMFILFWLGSFWREDEIAAPVAPQDLPPVPPSASTARLAAAALAIAVCTLAWPAYLLVLERSAGAPAPLALTGLSGVTPAAEFADWKPNFLKPAADLRQFFGDQAQPVALALLYYRHQNEESKLVSSVNRMTPKDDKNSNAIDMGTRKEVVGTRTLGLRETTVVGARSRLLVWRWYWIDGQSTPNDYVGKLLQIRQRLLHGRDDGAVVMVYTTVDEHDRAPARAALRGFVGAHLAAIDAALAAQRRP